MYTNGIFSAIVGAFMESGFNLSDLLKEKNSISTGEQIKIVWSLSVPGILAQISSIVMQYIDAAMVGSLGAAASASIGLVASSTWLLGGLVMACSSGFSVQIAQAVGAGSNQRARNILRQAIIFCALFSLILAALGVSAAGFIPSWLGGGEEIRKDASVYFLVFALCLPVMQMNSLMGNSLECSGNMRVPGILNALMCLMDVIFNFLFIKIMGLGVCGAALGTACAETLCAVLMIYFTCIKSPVLSLRSRKFKDREASWRMHRECVSRAAKISLPMALEQAALSGAMVMTTRIISPLGTTALAANSFAVTAEALCYMPGYGIGHAATTLVGQSFGARRNDLAKRFAWVSVLAGMTIMGVMGVAMYFLCPAVFSFLTPDNEVRALGTQVLRIELWAEPLFGASIICSGALRGAGDTLIPGIMNLMSIWGVRLTTAFFLTKTMGLKGAWIAMCVELCFRGAIFLIRLARGKSLRTHQNLNGE